MCVMSEQIQRPLVISLKTVLIRLFLLTTTTMKFYLPLNMIFSVSEEAQVRFGMSRALSRPPLVEMRTGFQLDSQSPVKTGSGGNRTLDPFVADQIDLGYEYYWSSDQAMTVSTFFKDLKTHVGSSTDVMIVDGVAYDFTGPINGDGGQIKGLELMYQQALTMLPAPFDGLGFYANYSLTDSNVTEFVPEDNPLPLGGLSRHVGNLTLWYYKQVLMPRSRTTTAVPTPVLAAGRQRKSPEPKQNVL